MVLLIKFRFNVLKVSTFHHLSKQKAPWSDSRGPDRFRSLSRRLRLTATGRVRGTFPLHNKAPAGGSSCRGLCGWILPELTGKHQLLLRRELLVEQFAFRLVYKIALWRSILAGDASEIA